MRNANEIAADQAMIRVAFPRDSTTSCGTEQNRERFKQAGYDALSMIVPKRNANGVRNPFYESIWEVGPRTIGESYCYERSPKSEEFGGAGPNWEAIEWRIRNRDRDPLFQR